MKRKNNNFPKANLEIMSRTVRLINSNADMIGVVSIDEALRAAKSEGLDLVEISPNAEPPVCKVMDFGRHKYQEKKKMQNAKKKQKVVMLKEIKVRPTISDHDLQIKVKNLNGFILDGDKVKVSLRFKGREITHQEVGFAVFAKLKTWLVEEAKIEHEPRMEGNQIVMIVIPK